MARGGRTLVRDVSFRMGPGEAVQVTGPNGVGKSTLLRGLAGLLPLAAGLVRWREPDEATEGALMERLHYVGHADGLKAALTARENLAFGAALAGRVALSPEEALERAGLPQVIDLPVAFLSAGQRRRVALARLLAADRPLWLLDEPATALDRAALALLGAMMADHLAGGGLIVAATHAPLELGAARGLSLEAE